MTGVQCDHAGRAVESVNADGRTQEDPEKLAFVVLEPRCRAGVLLDKRLPERMDRPERRVSSERVLHFVPTHLQCRCRDADSKRTTKRSTLFGDCDLRTIRNETERF